MSEQQRTLLVTSPGAAEGKSVVAANLATAFAQAGLRAAIVDAEHAFDPTWAKKLGVEAVHVNSVGMQFVLIPAGSYSMGSPLDERFRGHSEVQHPVTITRAMPGASSNSNGVGRWSMGHSGEMS